MANKSKPKTEGMPFWPEHLGPKLGSGQDNVVFRMVGNDGKPHLRPPLGKVLKINHDSVREHHIRFSDERKAAWAGVQYKKHKYDVLKLFLGDFVPDSSFVLGKVQEGYNSRYAEYTVQKEVSRLSIGDLTAEQKNDPRLHGQVIDLMARLKYMYTVLGEANARTSQGVLLDGKLDLGGVSDYVRVEDIGHHFDDIDATKIIERNDSPNLLVDPSEMRLYCVDFDQGQWTQGMQEAQNLAESIVKRDRVLGQVTIGAALTPGSDTLPLPLIFGAQ